MNIFTLPIAMFGMPAGAELIVLAVVVLVLFGGKKIPELMRGLGQGVGELKKGLDEGKQAISEVHKPDEKTEVKPEEKIEAKPEEKVEAK